MNANALEDIIKIAWMSDGLDYMTTKILHVIFAQLDALCN